jgi:hypothetical protein
MEIEEYDMFIINAETKIQKEAERSEQFMKEFIESTVRLCAGKVGNIINERIIKEPQITKKLGEKGLEDLLSKKEGFLAELPLIVENALDNDIIWKYKILLSNPKDKSVSNDSYDGSDFKRNITSPLHMVIGNVIEILLEFGYYKDSPYWYKSDNNKIVYAGEIEFNHEMDTVAVNYLNSYHILHNSVKNLQNLKIKKDELEAENLLKKVKSSLK